MEGLWGPSGRGVLGGIAVDGGLGQSQRGMRDWADGGRVSVKLALAPSLLAREPAVVGWSLL